MASIVERPIADPSSSVRRPSPRTRTCWRCRCRTSPTSAAFVETATKCFAIDVSSPRDARQRPRARGPGVGHRLQRGERLGRHDEERLRRIEIAHRLGEVGAVDVRDEPEGEAALAVVPERLVGHDRAQVGTADADVDDVADRLACMAFPGAAAHAIREVGHAVEHRVDLGHHVHAVDYDRCAARRAQRDVEDGAVLRDVDLLAGEHGVDAGAQAGCLGEPNEQRQCVVGDPVLRIVQIDARGFECQPFAALRIAREQLTKMDRANAPTVLDRALSRPVARSRARCRSP